jgi:hypothetical protein
MIKNIRVSASMTVGELIRNFEHTFYDPTGDTRTSIDFVDAEGLVPNFFCKLKDLSQNSNFRDCVIPINNTQIFKSDKMFKEKTGLLVQLDYSKNSLTV